LNGTSQYLTLGSSVQFDSGDFTVEGWFNTTLAPGSETIWASGASDSSAGYVRLRVSSDHVSADVRDVNNPLSLRSNGNYADGTWHHAALTRAGSAFTLYVDGALAVNASAALGDVDQAGVV